ncbi:MAG: MurR/RpiR family transcriptional regulator [Burkholderiales bacterium]
MGAREQILDQFSALTPTLQAAARFIVDHPNEVVIASMRNIAEQAGAQPATLVRLAQQLGYRGWPELKTAFAHDLGLHSATYGERAKDLARRGRGQDLARELFAVQRSNLDTTEAAVAPRLDAAVKLLRKARAVHIAGFRASHPVAFSLFYGYRLFRNSVFLVDHHGAGLETQLRAVEKGDVVVVISFAPYSREAMLVATHAHKAGASVVALADSSAAPLALDAQVVLPFSVASPSFFPSVAAGVALTEALLEQLVAEGGDTVVARIDRVERELYDSGAYLQRPARRG